MKSFAVGAEKITVEEAKKLIVQCDKYASAFRKREDRARYNERFVGGEQWIAFNQTTNSITNLPWDAFSGVPQVKRNYLQNLVLHWAAEITEERPHIRAYPADPSIKDSRASEVANSLIRYMHNVHNLDKLIHESAVIAQTQGWVGIKVFWDSDSGRYIPPYERLDEFGNVVVSADNKPVVDGGEHEGDVRFELVTLFDVRTDGAQNIGDSRWVIFVTYMDVFDAKAEAKAAGYDKDDVDSVHATSYTGALDNEHHEGVCVHELWYRPCKQYPQGLYIKQVGGLVVDAREFPYQHGELPIAVWKPIEVRGSPWGRSQVDDCIGLQMEINEAASVGTKQVRDMGYTKVLMLKSISDKWGSGDNGVIEVDTPEELNGVTFLEPPPLQRLATEAKADVKAEMLDIFGFNESSTGMEPVKAGTTGRTIAYNVQQDKKKTRGASLALYACIKRMYSQALRLYQQFVSEERTIVLTGQSNTIGVMSFLGADLQGVDVLLEPRSAVDELAAARGEQAAAMAQVPPALREQIENGQSVSTSDADMKAKANGMLSVALQGQQVQPNPQINPAIFLQEAEALLSLESEVPPSVTQLIQAYQQLLQQMQQQQAQATAQPQQGV